ncbi:Rho GTPase activation protein [Pseudocohnilembus persalinus]|uniref:Rho GTPase activation protein n=1 Tax=Pseudocohnilembus persalinus TaxID=266149 RepID=A0A0V0QIW0_PSEPJ|nr:Rho GTPase activation protein [Pseudocohnilembus persalinus]|eukprot:KRX02107.1 Rho GTPase activation protein [Pseudocohnilembus persalinus]
MEQGQDDEQTAEFHKQNSIKRKENDYINQKILESNSFQIVGLSQSFNQLKTSQFVESQTSLNQDSPYQKNQQEQKLIQSNVQNQENIEFPALNQDLQSTNQNFNSLYLNDLTDQEQLNELKKRGLSEDLMLIQSKEKKGNKNQQQMEQNNKNLEQEEEKQDRIFLEIIEENKNESKLSKDSKKSVKNLRDICYNYTNMHIIYKNWIKKRQDDGRKQKQEFTDMNPQSHIQKLQKSHKPQKLYVQQEIQNELGTEFANLKDFFFIINEQPAFFGKVIADARDKYDKVFDDFIDSVNNFYFENILNQNSFESPLFVVLAKMLQVEFDFYNNKEKLFSSNNLCNKMIYGFTKRIECLNYIQEVFKYPLTDIQLQNGEVQIDPLEVYESLIKESNKKERSNKNPNILPIQKQRTYQSSGNQNGQFSKNRKNSEEKSKNRLEEILEEDQSQNNLMNSSQQSQPKQKAEKSIFQFLTGYFNSEKTDMSSTKNKQSRASVTENGNNAKNTMRDSISDVQVQITDNTSFLSSNRKLDRMSMYSEEMNLKQDSFICTDFTNTKNQFNTSNKVDSFSSNGSERQQGRQIYEDKFGIYREVSDGLFCGINDLNQKIIKETEKSVLKNVDLLEKLSKAMIDSIISHIHHIPIGIKIICKMIEILCKQKFTRITYKEQNLSHVIKVCLKVFKLEELGDSLQGQHRMNNFIAKQQKRIEQFYKDLLNIDEEAVQQILINSQKSDIQNNHLEYNTMLMGCDKILKKLHEDKYSYCFLFNENELISQNYEEMCLNIQINKQDPKEEQILKKVEQLFIQFLKQCVQINSEILKISSQQHINILDVINLYIQGNPQQKQNKVYASLHLQANYIVSMLDLLPANFSYQQLLNQLEEKIEDENNNNSSLSQKNKDLLDEKPKTRERVTSLRDQIKEVEASNISKFIKELSSIAIVKLGITQGKNLNRKIYNKGNTQNNNGKLIM